MCTRKWAASSWHCNFTTKTLHCSLNTSHKGTPTLVLQASYMKWILCCDWLPTSFQQEQLFFFWPCHKSFFLERLFIQFFWGWYNPFFAFFEIDQHPTVILTLICLDYNFYILDIFEKLMAALLSRNLLYSVYSGSSPNRHSHKRTTLVTAVTFTKSRFSFNSQTNSVFSHSCKRPASSSYRLLFFPSRGCPLTRASTVLQLHKGILIHTFCLLI